MKRCFEILTLVLCVAIVGCGSSGGASQNTPVTPSVTTVTVTPPSATVISGQQQQFSAKVTGDGSFNQVVNWSVTGDGTISNIGMFTAGGATTGAATVTATSVEDSSVTGSSEVTVSAIANGGEQFYGTVTSANSTVMPLDFSLQETVTADGATISTSAYGPLDISLGPTPPPPSCMNLSVPSIVKGVGISTSGNMNNPNQLPNNPQIQFVFGEGQGLFAGTLSSELTVSENGGGMETLALTGQFNADGSLSGTYTNTGFQAGCFSSGSSGTFKFSKIAALGGAYSGSFAYGTQGQIPITLTFSGASPSVTIGAIPGVCGSSTTIPMASAEQDGRFFFMHYSNFTQPSLLYVWGVVNDSAGGSITIYTSGGVSGCGAGAVGLMGITLTAVN